MKNPLAHLMLALSLLGMIACSSTRKKAAEAPPKTAVGAWSVVVAGTPMGDIPADLIFEPDGDGYSGYIMAETEKNTLRDLKIVDNKVSGSFYSPAYGTDIYFDATYNPETDTVEGWMMNDFKFTGKRKVMADE